MVSLNYQQILSYNLVLHSHINFLSMPSKFFLRIGLVLAVKFGRSLFDNMYLFIGLLIALNNRDISTTIVLRNVMALYTLEYTFFVYSPLVSVYLSFYNSRIIFSKNRYKFLRRKPAPLSSYPFDYKLLLKV